MPKPIEPVGQRRNTQEYLIRNRSRSGLFVTEEEQQLEIIEERETKELISFSKTKFVNAIFLLELE
jgi:hypothetical protein